MNKKEELLALIHGNGYRGMHAAQLSRALDMEDSASFTELMKLLNELEAQHILARDAKERYFTSEELGYVSGTLRINPKGFGFVETAESSYYIGRDHLGLGMDHDTVYARTWTNNDKSVEGEVVEVLEHSVKQLVGTVKIKEGRKYFLSDGFLNYRKVRVTNFDDFRLVNDSKVLLGIDSYGTVLKCHIIREIGYKYDPGIDILSVLLEKDINPQFPEDVMQEVQQIPETIHEDEITQREDFRRLLTITIDGDDAKDLDDAISVEKLDNNKGYRLYVHIADVSHYVRAGSAIDQEAYARGTSVYVVDRVVPMLPHALCNGICSLNAGEDRLALSCIMKIDSRGRVAESRMAETVIRVSRRMTYTDVNRILTEQPPELMEEYRELVPMFFLMEELAEILRKNRSARGAIDFEFPESKIILDGKGRPVDIRPYEQNAATRLIEDFMLMANETVARTYCQKEIPFLYRTHDNPDMDRMEAVLSFIRKQGIKVEKSSEEITPGEIQKILQQIQGSPQEALISRLLLRSMKQARYTTGCSGHFGLAAKYYCHFTSPIRRYPDLQIHRIIKDDLRGRLREEKIAYYAGILENAALQSSLTERRAQEAERETDKLKMAEYMAARIGQEYEGVISGVTGWGFYVELPSTVEGLVHVSTLRGDYYHFDEDNYRLIGEITKREFTLGQRVRVRVADADVETKTVDFVLTGEREDE